MHFKGQDSGQLFDLISDPGEKNNLWNEPTAASVKQGLLDVMREWLIDTSVRTRSARRRAVDSGPMNQQGLQESNNA